MKERERREEQHQLPSGAQRVLLAFHESLEMAL